MEKKIMNKDDFLYPRGRYYGHVKPENLVFNANLQEFAQRISYICRDWWKAHPRRSLRTNQSFMETTEKNEKTTANWQKSLSK